MKKEERQKKIDELQAKYKKLRELAMKIATEMDSLADQYNQIIKEEEEEGTHG